MQRVRWADDDRGYVQGIDGAAEVYVVTFQDEWQPVRDLLRDYEHGVTLAFLRERLGWSTKVAHAFARMVRNHQIDGVRVAGSSPEKFTTRESKWTRKVWNRKQRD